MALSKKALKRRNNSSKVTHLLILAAARHMNETAEEYNATFQQRMSSKHHPEQVYRDAVKLVTAELYAKYRKARTTFFNLRRKHGVEFTNRVLRNVDTRPARNAVLRELLDPKPGLVRKQICGTAKQFFGRAVLPETTNPDTVTEMPFEVAVNVFKQHLVSALVKDHGVTVGDAVNMVEDHINNKDVLLDILNKLVEKEELKVCFVRHKVLPSDTPFNVTKITDV